jgi:hypothetical protein
VFYSRYEQSKHSQEIREKNLLKVSNCYHVNVLLNGTVWQCLVRMCHLINLWENKVQFVTIATAG